MDVSGTLISNFTSQRDLNNISLATPAKGPKDNIGMLRNFCHVTGIRRFLHLSHVDICDVT